MTPDALTTPDLTERQQKILALVVREYINKPEPVGSKLLVENYLTNVSSATIRNDMALLEELGLLTAPHTSAGRIPTEAGYRYFVKWLLNEPDLPLEEQKIISGEFSNAPNDVEVWMRLAVTTLVRTSRGAAFVTAPRTINSQYKHLALISTYGRMVMMVLVLHGGDVRQQILTLADTLSQETLSTVANRLNSICDGLNYEQLRAKARTLDNELEREIIEIVAMLLEENDKMYAPVAFQDGLSELLPEFTESEGAQQALRIMEERTLLTAIVSEVLTQRTGDVQVIIAGNGRWHEVRHLSMVLSNYGIRGRSEGTLAVLGPTRMRYGRAIAGMRYVAGLMSNLLLDRYSIDSNNVPEN